MERRVDPAGGVGNMAVVSGFVLACVPDSLRKIKHLSSKRNADLGKMIQQVRRVLVNAISARLRQFRLAIAAAAQADR